MSIFHKPKRELIGFNDLWLRLVGIPLVALITPLAFFQASLDQPEKYWTQVLVSLLFTFVYWHVDWFIVCIHRDRYPRFEQTGKRIALQMVWILTFTLLVCNSGELCMMIANQGLDSAFIPSPVQINFGSMVITIAIVSIYETIYAVSRWKQSLLESERLKKENIHSQLETLKNQVNPHFLFNSLNTLTSIIHESPDKAVEFVQHLSNVYRYILEIKDKELITLREEMECISSYRFMLEMRFGPNLQFEVNIPEEKMDSYIVPLSAQILLENAIKHNVISTSRPLKIIFSIAKNGHLLVTNNLQKKEVVNGSTKTGLANIRNRYKIISGKDADVIVTQDHFSVSLPLIQISNE